MATPSFNKYKIAHILLGRSFTLYFETVLGMNKITSTLPSPPKNKIFFYFNDRESLVTSLLVFLIRSFIAIIKFKIYSSATTLNLTFFVNQCRNKIKNIFLNKYVHFVEFREYSVILDDRIRKISYCPAKVPRCRSPWVFTTGMENVTDYVIVQNDRKGSNDLGALFCCSLKHNMSIRYVIFFY